MGQSKQRVATILKLSRECIFCAGAAPATTVDHQPARALFDRRQCPEGYAFPACEPCNQSSKEAEHKLALLSRIDINPQDDPVRIAEFDKFARAMRNNFPGFLHALSANEKRRFLRSQGLNRPPGMALSEMYAAGVSAPDARQLFETCIHKLLCALHWKHTGHIVRNHDGVIATWILNAYFGEFIKTDEARLYETLPACPPIMRNGRNLSDQFGYRYGVDDDKTTSVFFIAFRNAILVQGFVSQSVETLNQLRASIEAPTHTPTSHTPAAD